MDAEDSHKDTPGEVTEAISEVASEPKGILRKPGEKRTARGTLVMEHNETDPERTRDQQKKRKHLKRQDTTYVKEQPKDVIADGAVEAADATPMGREKRRASNPMNKGAMKSGNSSSPSHASSSRNSGNGSTGPSGRNSQENLDAKTVSLSATTNTEPFRTGKKSRERSHSQGAPMNAQGKRARSSSFGGKEKEKKTSASTPVSPTQLPHNPKDKENCVIS